MIFLNLIIYNKLILFSKNNIRSNETESEISLILNKIIYLNCELY